MEHHGTSQVYRGPRSLGLRKILIILREFLSAWPDQISAEILSDKLGPHLARDIGLEPPERRISVPRHPML